jgi:hypothetical protein
MIILLLVLVGVGLVMASDVTQVVRVNVLPGAVNVHSPMDGAIYDSRMVGINLSMSSEVRYFKYSDNGGRLRSLCRNCASYGFDKIKRKPFNDGFHSVDIVGIFETGNVVHNVNFLVDSRAPKVKKVSPTRGFGDGEFSVEVQEENLIGVVLNYGNDVVGWREEVLNLDDDCYNIKKDRIKCEVSVDLDDYDLTEIKYWFEVEDILERVDESRVKVLDVDVSLPILLNEGDFWNQGVGRENRYIYFDMKINEPNFDEVVYVYEDSKGRVREKRLCSRLKDGVCEKRKSFRDGVYDGEVVIRDDAGNVVSYDVGFVVE